MGLARKNMLISYAADFVSYMLSSKDIEGHKIRSIILYGSVARGDFTKESDIDIFVDCENPEAIEKKIGQMAISFLDSIWFKKWKRLGIKNNISVITGNVEEWKDLKPSMASNGIVLYGRYSPLQKGKRAVILTFAAIRPEPKRVFINRKLFGYMRYKKRYAGILEEAGAEKLAPGCIMVPVRNVKPVLSFLRSQKVQVNIREIIAL